MVPVAGSAYTYAYATLGELFAWIIGWDLILEYAVGAATVANGWSGYFQSVLAKFGVHLPAALAGPPIIYDTAAGHFVRTAGVVNLPAILIVALVTVVLVKGIQESAGFNTTMVFLKVAVVLFVILVGAFYVNPENWTPFAPYGMTRHQLLRPPAARAGQRRRPAGRHAGRRGDHLLRLHRLRLGVDARRGGEEPHARRADRHHRVAAASAPCSTSPWSPC